MARGKGEGSIFKDGRGLWTAVVELPPRNGDRRRKVIRSKDKKVVVAKLSALKEELRKRGDLPTRDITVEAWIDEWFTTIAAQKNRPKTLSTYKGLIRREILPVIGAKKLDKLTPADVREMNLGMQRKGLSSSTAMQVHRILSVALKYAEQEGKVARNVATLVDAPRRSTPQLAALTLDEALKVLEVASTIKNGSLAAAILLTGARQGELLGLEIDRVGDLLDMSWQLQRLTWEHGCDGDCGRVRGSDCRRRKITAPPDWQNRHIQGGLWWTRPKTDAGWRIIPLVEPLKTIIEKHIADTAHLPNPHGLVWHGADGAPIDPRVENEWWHALLDRAGVTQVRLHDGRHATVDLLLLAGVDEDIIQEIVGHSTRAQTRKYKTRGNIARLTEAMNALGALVTPTTPVATLEESA